VVVNT
jgi:DNA-directed RNA polymerase III subunit RPC1